MTTPRPMPGGLFDRPDAAEDGFPAWPRDDPALAARDDAVRRMRRVLPPPGADRLGILDLWCLRAAVRAADPDVPAAATAVVHADGSCRPNPGRGGWAAVLDVDGERRTLSGAVPGPTTNNRMELTAAIEALHALPSPADVVLVTDSEYLRRGIAVYVPGWRARGWTRGRRSTPVPNADLWRVLDHLDAVHRIEWRRVPGHAGNELNELADRLAGKARDRAGPDQAGTP